MIPAYIAAAALKKSRSDESVHMYATHLTTVTSKKKKKAQSPAVIHAKGGGGPKIPSPKEEADAQIILEQEKARLAEEKAARDKAAAELARKELLTKAAGKRTQALDYANSYDETELANRGISDALASKYGIRSMYDNSLNKAVMGIAEDDLNPLQSLSTGTWLEDAITKGQGRYRSDLTKGVQSLAGDGFEYGAFADNSDDDILMKLLTGQKTDALTQIDAAKARGQLNDVGYSNAMKQLATAEASGMADLQTLGQGVLSGYRKDLTTLRDNQLNKVGNLTFSDSYDPDAFANLLTGRTNDMKNRLEGDIFKAANGKSFFDASKIISGGGALQGYYNPTTGSQESSTAKIGSSNSLLDAFAQDEAAKKKNTQGTATSINGVF